MWKAVLLLGVVTGSGLNLNSPWLGGRLKRRSRRGLQVPVSLVAGPLLVAEELLFVLCQGVFHFGF